jgi:beta-glucosidase
MAEAGIIHHFNQLGHAMPDQWRQFPQGFLWGAATASHQVEGDNSNNDWWQWEQAPGHIVDGTRSGQAAKWWSGRAEEDLTLAAEMGHNAHRMSLEWSRLEPSPGIYDDAAFARYRKILSTMQELGMSRSVTIYHFTLPQWVAARGSWTSPGIVEQFARFAQECVLRLGDLVDWWATINEPMMGYLGRRWPPGAGSLASSLKAAANLLRAHHEAFLRCKDQSPDAQIGIVLNIPSIQPAGERAADRGVASIQDWLMNEMMLRAVEQGELSLPLATRREALHAGPGASDWFGLNYYGRHLMRFTPTKPADFFGEQVQDGVRSDEGNWGEIYPQGLTDGLLRLARFGKPLFVTENGIFDNQDTQRPAYLVRHVRATYDALQQGADVRGYFHWTLVDNFEWAEGWTTRFGLIEVDPETQQRQPRRSASVFQEVIDKNGITPQLWKDVVGI